ncbi:MAG: hypothetical protein AAF791_02730 [Bacteroidota bacterium]
MTFPRILGAAALLFIGTLALASSASAQGRGAQDPAERIARQIQSLDEALDLTDEQATQIRALFEAEAAERPARGARGSGDREAMRAQRAEQRAEMNRRIEALLSPQQVERFRAWTETQRDRRGRRGSGS